jgi:acyl-CoA synthetase (AMP-forming)/AMP-acid ligase II
MGERPFDDFAALLTALGRLADEAPDRPALTCYRGRALTGALTRRELLHRVAAVQRYLAAALGLEPGDRVAVLAPNRLEIPVLYLAALRMGAVLVPLNPTSPPDDWRFVVDHSGAKILVADGDLLPRLPPMPVPVCRLEETAPPGPPPAIEPARPHGDDLAIVHYPSGSTGLPKGVGLSQRNVLANAWSLARVLGMECTTQLVVLPPYHAHAFGFGLMSALVSGSHLVLAERFDPFGWAEIIAHEKVTVTGVMPTFLPPLREAHVQASAVPTLRHLLVSSAPLAPALARDFETETGIRLLQAWGLSEYGNFACCLDPALPDEERRALLYGGPHSGVGGPLPGTEVKVVDTQARALGPEAPGELCVRGPSRMLGYFRDEGATQEVVDGEGWLRTGDEGYFRMHKGEPVFFVTGRRKQIIIRGGEKLSPVAIEDKLLAALPELTGLLAVVGFPHRVFGEEVGAYVQSAVLEDSLRSGLTATLDTLGPDLRPKVVLFGAAPIPRSDDGGVQRDALEPLFAAYADCRGPVQIEAAPGPV